MRTVSKLYKYAKDENQTLLFPDSGITYPTIEGNTSNFLEDYNANHEELDRMFWLKYSSMKCILPDDFDEEINVYFNDWKECVKSVLYYYLDAWARLYYALNLQYNPIYNVDVVTTTETEGQTEGLSGTDTTTDRIAAHVKNLNYGADTTDHDYGTHTDDTTSHEVPNDSVNEKEVGKSVDTYGAHTDTDTRAAHQDTFTDQAYNDSHATEYGKINEVDYTVTETKRGNQGITMTTDMLNEEWKWRQHSFWENCFKAICRELLFW